MERRVDLAGGRVISPAPIYGGIDKHIRKGINLYGWNALSQVLETRY